MRSLRFALAAATMIASAAFASPSDPKTGAEFQTLAAPQPTQVVGKKIEVIEFFAYHCPACNVMEPFVEAWVKKQGDNIVFKRIPFPFTGPNDPEAHLYLTLEAMGKAETMGPKIFRAFHLERQRLVRDDVIIEWIAKNGVDKAKFLEYWNSFGVLTKLKRLPQIVIAYKVDGTPSFVIDGRYITSPSMVVEVNKSFQNQYPQAAMATMDALVAKAMKDKGITPVAVKTASK